jgi:hypothetical protein
LCCSLLTLSGCEYVRLLRPSVLKQLNPRVVRLVNELPEVDHPNEAIVARLFAHGGLSHAKLGGDGIFHAASTSRKISTSGIQPSSSWSAAETSSWSSQTTTS